ncbi:MAG: hypothetical protein ACOYBC_06025 [Bilifractor sp.]|jgi:ADP-ribosylglycohydrolase
MNHNIGGSVDQLIRKLKQVPEKTYIKAAAAGTAVILTAAVVKTISGGSGKSGEKDAIYIEKQLAREKAHKARQRDLLIRTAAALIQRIPV